jgi:hypothetical protein
MAVIQAGFPRATGDIDLLIDVAPENQERVRRALMKLPDQAVRDMTEEDLDRYVVVRVADAIVVDLMKAACAIGPGRAAPRDRSRRPARLRSASYHGRKIAVLSRRVPMGAIEKVSVSLSTEDVVWAKKRAQRQLKSLSAVVSEALRRQRQAEAGALLLEELGTDDVTEADLDAMREELGWKPKRKPRGARSSRARKR